MKIIDNVKTEKSQNDAQNSDLVSPRTIDGNQSRKKTMKTFKKNQFLSTPKA
jgi:hypothetical protein